MGLGEPSVAEQLKVPLHHLVYGWSIDPRVGANRGPNGEVLRGHLAVVIGQVARQQKRRSVLLRYCPRDTCVRTLA